MRAYAPAGSRCSTRSIRLTASKYWLQSRVAHRRRLVITLATETWAAAWRWCSLRIASSEVVCCGREVLVHRGAHGGQPRPVLAQALEELDDVGGVEVLGQGRRRAVPSASSRAT